MRVQGVTYHTIKLSLCVCGEYAAEEDYAMERTSASARCCASQSRTLAASHALACASAAAARNSAASTRAADASATALAAATREDAIAIAACAGGRKGRLQALRVWVTCHCTYTQQKGDRYGYLFRNS